MNTSPKQLLEHRIIAVCVLIGLGVCAIFADSPKTPTDLGVIFTPTAAMQTAPVPHGGDAADDPAIWLHPTDPDLSLIIGTDKLGGLISYDLDGKQLQIVSDGSLPDNVDVIYDFPLGGAKVDLAVAGCRGSKSLGLKIWAIDRQTRKLSHITQGGAIPVFGHTEPYGTGVYHSQKSGKFYVFVNNKRGAQEQYELEEAANGLVGAKRVRSFKLGSITEGCVCDDEMGLVYIAEESVGIWKFSAEPDSIEKGVLIARCGEHGLKGDVEGLTIYHTSSGKGYLIASSQGNNTFKIYRREGDNEFIGTIIPKGGAINAVSDTDGIAVTNRPLGKNFPKGAIVVQDGNNRGGNQNFKLYRWEDVAGNVLTIDPAWDPRKPKYLR